MTVQPVLRPEPAMPALRSVPRPVSDPDAKPASLMSRILDAEDNLDIALLALIEAAQQVRDAEDALADLISVKDDA